MVRVRRRIQRAGYAHYHGKLHSASCPLLVSRADGRHSQDITTDGFGFMLSVGDLVWVPFTYCYSARYVALYPKDLGILGTAAVLAVQFTGYWMFRGANGEKNQFRSGQNPKSEHSDLPVATIHVSPLKLTVLPGLQTCPTSRLSVVLSCSPRDGGDGPATPTSQLHCTGIPSREMGADQRLTVCVCSFGDWLMSWAWCLPAGFSTPLPYFYVIFFAILLVHRQMRDDEACEKK